MKKGKLFVVPLFLLFILAGCASDGLLEDLAEVLRRVEPCHVGDLRDGQSVVLHELEGTLDAHLADEGYGRHPGDGLEFAVEHGAAHEEVFRQGLDFEVLVVHVLLDALHDLLHEAVVE